MNLLPMDEDTIQRARQLARRASHPPNWYRPADGQLAPGDSPTYTEMFGPFKVVFTWTVDLAVGLLRHMSISAPQGLPHPVAVWTIANWLGFKGATVRPDGVVLRAAPGWTLSHNKSGRCIVIAETIPSEELPLA